MARSDQQKQREFTAIDSPTRSGAALSTSLIAPAGITIGAASQVLGVPTRTIRSWERRYEIAAPGSTPGGHRRYGEADLIRLRLMRRRNHQGTTPGPGG